MATSINTLCISQPTSDASKAVLYIELQAVTQVIAQQLALHLDPEKRGDVIHVIKELNRLMDDEITGGGPEGGHRMVVALHLVKVLKSFRKFSDLFKKNCDTILKEINCLEPFYRQLQVCNVYSLCYTCTVALILHYASRRSRTRDSHTVKLTVCVCVCLFQL